MDISYTYAKCRKECGRQPMFCESPVQLLDSIEPDIKEQKNYILRNPVHKQAQVGKEVSQHYINTRRVVMSCSGVNHGEGGWPKEVNFWDEEATTRVRRRVERDDDYVDAVLSMFPNLERYVNQNNAIELYEMYFKTMKSQKPLENSSIRLKNAFKDPLNRPISSIAWTIEDDSKVVVSYCNRKYPIPALGLVNKDFTCFYWDLENPLSPHTTFDPPNPIWQLVCSPVSPDIVVAGLNDGRVCMFDIRANSKPISYCSMHLAHRNPVTAIMYMFSRANNEFFSGSTDGSVMWWDIRNLSEPTETMTMAIRTPPGKAPSLAYAEGISVLQFERTIPTKFLCGTDTGFVINVNRKGKTFNETMSAIFAAQNGPVKSLYRSPCIMKLFVTCGDWTINLWSDDIPISPIITGSPQKYQINDVIWAPCRNSSYMSVTSDGMFHYWDILRSYREPIISMPVSNSPLLKVKPHDQGKLVVMGDDKGALYLYKLSNNLVYSEDNDKQLLTSIYERETRREHILETRVKEIMLKRKADDDKGTAITEEYIDEEALVKTADNEYKTTVSEEIKRTGYTPAKKG